MHALCVSRVVNTHAVLCGSFYAPSINFHSFIYSFMTKDNHDNNDNDEEDYHIPNAF